MTKINLSRVAIGGMIWFASYNLLTAITWLTLLHWQGIPGFHPVLGTPQNIGLPRLSLLFVFTTMMGMLASWLYAAIRPRYNKQRVAAVYVGMALFLMWSLPQTLPTPEYPWGALVTEWISKLFVLIASTALAGAVYRDEEDAGPRQEDRVTA